MHSLREALTGSRATRLAGDKPAGPVLGRNAEGEIQGAFFRVRISMLPRPAGMKSP